MGTPVGARLYHDDGAPEYLDDVTRAVSMAMDGDCCVELQYDYNPGLLPPPGPLEGGMWRYANLLPLGDSPITYPLPVGNTPLVPAPALRRALGMEHLWLKDETRGPSGSNKDRATALVLQHAVSTGITTVSCASTGNVAVSLAVGAAAVGMRAVIFVPADVDEMKLAVMLFTGATVVKVREGYAAAFRLSREAARALGWCDRNTGVNPLTLEAKKTVAFEIWEQLGREVPDVVVAPVGDGVTLAALVKGFDELVACGVARTTPRIIGVQADGCQPIKRAWETGADRIQPVLPKTIADGIAVGEPVYGRMALRAVRRCGGSFVAVSDDELLEAMHLLASKAGILAEPAGAAAFAGLMRALSEGHLAREERVVALVTGSALKTPRFLAPKRAPIEVHADMDALRHVLKEHAAL